jgi:Protein of unknown function (DUF429)
VDYRDIGVALVTCGGDERGASLSARAFDVPLGGRPSVHALASWLREMVEAHDVRCLCIDGPLGWRSPHTDSPHCRLSERVVRAPGKTGLPPDGVKPRTYLGFTTFSIALFEALLGDTDWALPGAPESTLPARVVTESFPTAGWRALGLSPLMAKGRASVADVHEAGARLQARTGITLEQVRTHDQLQAVVGGIAGAWWAAGLTDRVQLAGAPPFRLDGSWREGYIMVPARVPLSGPD